MSDDDFFKDINDQYNRFSKFSNNFEVIAYYGGNFGELDKSLRIELYEYANGLKFNNIHFSTSPETITDELVHEIKKYNITLVELGVQSLDDKTIASNGRSYTFKDVEKAIGMISKISDVGVQVMIGMYNQAALSVIDDAKILSKYPIKTVRIYPTVVLKDTVLESYYNKGEYTVMDMSESILISATAYIIYRYNGIDVLRLSLPANIDADDNIIAGLYHPAYGDIVKTAIALYYLELGGEFRGSRKDIYNYSGYRSIIKETYVNKFIEDDSVDCISFDKVVEFIYKRSEGFEDNSRLLKSETAKIIKKLRY